MAETIRLRNSNSPFHSPVMPTSSLKPKKVPTGKHSLRSVSGVEKTSWQYLKPEKFDMVALSAFIVKRMEQLDINPHAVARQSHNDEAERLLPEHVWRLVHHPEKYKFVKPATLQRLASGLRVPVTTLEAVVRGEAVDLNRLSVDLQGRVLAALKQEATHAGMDVSTYAAQILTQYTGLGINQRLHELKKAS
jgi:hypothetical protein